MINFSDLDKKAIITKDKNFTYKELINQINSYSKLFEGKEYKKVAIFSKNRAEWIFAFYAAWKNNCIVVPIDFMSSESEVAYIINDCKPELIFTGNNKKESLAKALSTIEHLPDVCVFEDLKIDDNKEDNTAWKDIENKSETAVIIYTSGTTGSPKGVMLSYSNLITNIEAVYKDAEIYDKNKQVLIFLPLHHIFPLVGSMAVPLYAGGTIVMSPSISNNDLTETLKNNKINIMLGVPRLYEAMYKGIKAKINSSYLGRLLLSIILKTKARGLAKIVFKKVHEGMGGNLRFIISGGVALPKYIGEFFYYLGFDILEGYGMTEAAPMISFSRPNHIVPGSVGEKLLNTQVKTNEKNEILVKGSNVMQGYFNRPKETADIIKDGWLHTGDLGYIDKKGLLFITGRKKEIIILSNGKNINPEEAEEKILKTSECISEVAVTMHDTKLHAIIVPNTNELIKHEVADFDKHFKTILNKYNKQVGPSKKIMNFTTTNGEIPKTRLGKIQRFKLEELIEKPVIKQTNETEPEYEEYKTIKNFIENEANTKVKPSDHLDFDIALDSLGKLSLIDFIDRSFGVKINENQLIKFTSVKKMVEFVKDNKLRHKIEHIDWSAILKEKANVTLPKSSITQGCFKNVSKVFFKVYFRFKSKGVENVPEGACIIAPNHQSFFDGLFVVTNLRNKIMRKTYFYAKRKHINNKVLRFLARKNNIIVMDINNNLKESIQKLAEVLKMGRKIIIFPEGTRTKDGSLGEFKKTFAILSKELNVPIVPVAINGAHKALPSGKKFPKIFSKVQVSFLPPVNPEKHTYESLSNMIRNSIDNKINSLA